MQEKIQTVSLLGCGWLGQALAEALLEQGYLVKGSTTTPEKLAWLAQAGIEPFHLVLDPEVRGEMVSSFFKAEVLFLNIPPRRAGGPEAARLFLDQIRAVQKELHYSPISWVLFASSTSVYDEMNGVVIERDAGRPAPPSPSGRALLEAEQLLLADTHFDTTVLRFAGLYGGDRHPGRFLAGRHAVKNGDAPVNLVHRDDCTGVVLAVLEQGARGEVFNVCADEHPTRRLYYPAAARRLGLEPPTFVSNGPVSFKTVSNEKVKRVLGYRFLHPDPSASML